MASSTAPAASSTTFTMPSLPAPEQRSGRVVEEDPLHTWSAEINRCARLTRSGLFRAVLSCSAWAQGLPPLPRTAAVVRTQWAALLPPVLQPPASAAAALWPLPVCLLGRCPASGQDDAYGLVDLTMQKDTLGIEATSLGARCGAGQQYCLDLQRWLSRSPPRLSNSSGPAKGLPMHSMPIPQSQAPAPRRRCP